MVEVVPNPAGEQMQRDIVTRFAKNDRLAPWIGFWWGFAEGLFFFIVPDVYISLAALFSLRAAATAWLASVAGSLLAIAVLYLVMIPLGLNFLSVLAFLPGISVDLLERVGTAVGAAGLPYTPLLILGGVPLKVYGAVAYSLGLNLQSVLLWTIFARIVRIAPTYAAFALIRLLWRRRIEAYPMPCCAALGLFWIAFYAFYFVQTSR